jgi:predicted DsbA family dithiol-disulfide isomerase
MVPRDGTRVVEVFADVLCPFTHVGLRRLVASREALGRRDPVLRVHAWPLELVNGEPLDAGLVAEEVEALRSSVAKHLFSGFDPSRWPASSLPALALAARGYRLGDRAGERVSLALRDAVFERGRDVADPAVLASIARSCDLDPPASREERERDLEAVLDDFAAGRARGVIGSPNFFIDGESFFCPNLRIERVGSELQVAIDRAALADFLGACFGPGAERA